MGTHLFGSPLYHVQYCTIFL